MNNTKYSILVTFYHILVKGKNHYIAPRPDVCIGLLGQYHDTTIGRRWFFQCCRDLEDAGYIVRRRRYAKMEFTEIRSLPSLFALTIKAYKFLRKKGVHAAETILKPMLKWLHRNDNRMPSAAELDPGEKQADRETAIKKIKELLATIGRRPADGNDPKR